MARGASGQRYAQAIFELSIAQGRLEPWADQLAFAAQVLQDAEFRAFLSHAEVPLERKTAAVDAVLQDVDPMVKNLVSLLVSRGAADALPDGISVKYGPIASGDEGIDSSARARQLIDLTGAIVAAWEGAGGAKACEFARIPYIEIRCVSDLADENAITDYRENTPIAMTNLAALTARLLDT